MHLAIALSLVGLATAQCPYGVNTPLRKRESNDAQLSSTEFLDQFTLNDTNSYFTSDVGGPIQEDTSLKAGERGPTLLEDFIFRQKIQHFDHERVCLRVSPTYGPSIDLLNRYRNVQFMPEVLVSITLYLP